MISKNLSVLIEEIRRLPLSAESVGPGLINVYYHE